MKAMWLNVYEYGACSYTSEATGYEFYRAYDRIFDKMYKANTTDAHDFFVYQNSGTWYPVDTLVIPAGHNLAGKTLVWKCYTGSTWAAVLIWVQPDNGLIFKQLDAPLTMEYWGLLVADAGAPAVEFGELWMGQLYDFECGMTPGTVYGYNPSGVVQRSIYNRTPHFLSLGNPRYFVKGKTTPIASTTHKNAMLSWFYLWLGSRPFFYQDNSGASFFAMFASNPEIEGDLGFVTANLDIEQVF